MRTINSLFFVFCALIFGMLVPLHASDGPVNVIVVMTDDQGYADLACHGNPVIQTPNMDMLAEQSVRFADFHVNPFSSTTRAALMTGRMSDRTGVTSTSTHRNYLRREEVIMPEFFKASGYRTGIFGKWHIGGNYPYRPIDRGFDEWLGLGNNGLATTSDFWNNDRMNDTYWHNGVPEKMDGFCTDVYFEEAMTFIKACKEKDQPSFTYIALNVPHWNWNVPEAWLEPYKDSCSREQAAFYASVNRVDWNLGRLMEFLEQEDLQDNTILVFLTDNGSDVPDKESAFTAQMRGFKGSLLEGGHRVPLFIHGPENLMGKPREIDAFTAHLDLLPTFIDLCNLKNPDRELLPMDGRSLRPLLSGDGEWAERLLVLHNHDGITPQKDLKAVVMTSEWRLIKEGPQRRELYNVRKDPSQQRSVAFQNPDIVRKLETIYSMHWESLDFDRPLERPILSNTATLQLTSDLTVGSNPIGQKAIREGRPVVSEWLLEVREPGPYRFEVRRWPRGVDVSMTDGLPPSSNSDIESIGHDDWRLDVPGVPLDISLVMMSFSNREIRYFPVMEDAEGVFVDIILPSGPLDLEAWFVDPNGERTGAYYVYARSPLAH